MNPTTERELTFGEKAVGLTFNPGGDAQVHEIKRECAALIDRLATLRSQAQDGDVIRMFSIAITETQTAQMWAVKAVTWK